jgi:hypothetical protein
MAIAPLLRQSPTTDGRVEATAAHVRRHLTGHHWQLPDVLQLLRMSEQCAMAEEEGESGDGARRHPRAAVGSSAVHGHPHQLCPNQIQVWGAGSGL